MISAPLNAIGEDSRMAPLSSSLPPAPEEFGDIIRAVLPYINRGLNNTTAAAIISASTASMGLSPDSFLPLFYYGNQNTYGNTLLSYSRDLIGLPMVPIEPFALNSFFGAEDTPNHIASYPTESHGKIVFSAYHGVNFWPRRFTQPSSLPPEDLESHVHPRELDRLSSGPGFYLKSITSTLRYTGCIRPATEEEITDLFSNTLLADSWLRHPDISLREFFLHMGISDTVWDEAANETDRLNRAEGVVPSASTATDVPSPRRGTVSVVREDLHDPVSDNNGIQPPEPSNRFFRTGATRPARPSPQRAPRPSGIDAAYAAMHGVSGPASSNSVTPPWPVDIISPSIAPRS